MLRVTTYTSSIFYFNPASLNENFIEKHLRFKCEEKKELIRTQLEPGILLCVNILLFLSPFGRLLHPLRQHFYLADPGGRSR